MTQFTDNDCGGSEVCSGCSSYRHGVYEDGSGDLEAIRITVERSSNPNRTIETLLSKRASCSMHIARKALEHGYMTIRQTSTRDRVAFALRKLDAVVSMYSKEHYP